MARGPERVPSDERVRRSVRRTLVNLFVLVVSLAVIGAWSYFGFYELQPGQAAVVLRLGRYAETVSEPGLRWHLPPPIETHEIVNVASIEREEFGMPAPGEAEPKGKALLEAQMQTGDNNIVNVSFVVRYMVKDAFQSRYRVAEPRQTLRDAFAICVLKQRAFSVECLRNRVDRNPRRRKQHRDQKGDRYESNEIRVELIRNFPPALRSVRTR